MVKFFSRSRETLSTTAISESNSFNEYRRCELGFELWEPSLAVTTDPVLVRRSWQGRRSVSAVLVTRSPSSRFTASSSSVTRPAASPCAATGLRRKRRLQVRAPAAGGRRSRAAFTISSVSRRRGRARPDGGAVSDPPPQRT